MCHPQIADRVGSSLRKEVEDLMRDREVHNQKAKIEALALREEAAKMEQSLRAAIRSQRLVGGDDPCIG
jgi:hypothetical protein